MITNDQVAELFARANPVPTAEVSSPDTALHDGATGRERSSGMTTVKPKQEPDTKRRRPLIAVGFAIVLGAVVAVPLLLNNSTTEPEVVAASPEDEAIKIAEDLFAALNRGDADAAVEFLQADQQTPPNTNAMAFFAALPGSKTVTDCSASADTSAVRVSCSSNFNGPLMQAVGEHSTAVFRVGEGSLTQMFIPGSRNQTGAAFSEYAVQADPEAYDQSCNPDSYGPDSVRTQRSGFAFAGPCGELWAQVADDAAAWVSDGMPPLTPGDAAIQTVEDLTETLSNGDGAAARALVEPQQEPMANAVEFLAALPGSKTVSDCRVIETTSRAVVDCLLTMDNAVFQATGETAVRASFIVEDGLIVSLTPGYHNKAGSAATEYLATTRPELFEQACDSSSYQSDSVVVSDDGFAFAGPCGALWARYDADIAAWVEAGQPSLAGN